MARAAFGRRFLQPNYNTGDRARIPAEILWLGRGVGRGLADGPTLGVGVGRGVAVADAVAIWLAAAIFAVLITGADAELVADAARLVRCHSPKDIESAPTKDVIWRARRHRTGWKK